MTLVSLLVPALYALLGWGLCVRWRLPARGLEGFAWAYGMGTGVASLGIMALVALGLWHPFAETPAYALLLLVLSVVLAGWKTRRPFAATDGVPRDRVPLAVPVAVALGFSALFVVLFLGRLVPVDRFDGGFDAQVYHLPAAARLARDGLGATVGLLDGEMRLGFDLLFVPSLDVAEPTAYGPAVVHLVATLALAAGIAGEIARRTSVAVGVGFGALFVVTPGVASIANHAYVDVGAGLYVFLALAAASRTLRDGDRASLVAAGLFAGFAANAKLPAGAAIGAVAVALFVGRRGAAGAKAAALSTLVAFLVCLPWFVRAYLNTGNPFFPALLDRFGSGWADADVVAATKRAVLDQLPIPRDALYGLRAIVHGAFSSKGGFEAPAWVVAFAPAALLRPRTPALRGLLAACGVLLVAWVAFVPLFRFGIGLWAWGAVAAAFGAARLARVARPAAVLTGLLLLGVLGIGVVGALKAPDSPRYRFVPILASRFGPAVEFLANPTQTVRGPIGLSSSFVAFGPPGTIALEPARNGLLRPEDFDDADRLRAALRRIGIRSLVLDATTVEGRKAIAFVSVWQQDPAVRIHVENVGNARGAVTTVTFPKDAPK